MVDLLPGDPAPWFYCAALDGNQRYAFDTTAGRHILMLFLGSAGLPASAAALATALRHRPLYDDDRVCFFGVTTDPSDVSDRRIEQSLPGIRHFLDYDGAVSRQYGAIPDGEKGDQVTYRPGWLLLDPALRVIARAPIERGEDIIAILRRELAAPPIVDHAPVLIVPRIFEPGLCRQLIDLYDRQGGEESGFMRDVNGKTTAIIDHAHKRRADCEIDDEALRTQLRARLKRFLLPQIERAYNFKVTRIERWIVACYDAGVGGHFRAHRDNTTKGTAHRRFACTINLNAGDYEGGDLRFPEYGTRSYRAPTGGAVIFGCSLLHEALPVRKGRRYAFLPFLYDEDGARIREANNQFLDPGVGQYRSGLSA